ncbi:hypothetical protein FRC07_006023 [Ceratobasidium sp. 392]|nr:hypothetical protein FRC07_006023 [Ceratobasidium sp. 392]
MLLTLLIFLVFPNRVGWVILDGVLDPWVWSTKPPLSTIDIILTDTQNVFNGFAGYCADTGPARCAIAQNGTSANDTLAWTLDLIKLAYDHTKTTGGTVITSGVLRDQSNPDLDFSAQAIACSDSMDDSYVATQDVFNFEVSTTDTRSKLLAHSSSIQGNYFDPVTPLTSAELVATAFGQSAAVVTQYLSYNKLPSTGHPSGLRRQTKAK